QTYERAARSIDTARQDLEAARSDLKRFEDAHGPRIAKVQQFLDSGKGTLTITVSREVFNPDTKENDRVREETTLKREQVVKMIKDDFETPLAEKKEALERAESGLANKEQVLKEYADKQIMGQPFKVFVKEFQRQANTLDELETKVKQTNSRKFEAQDQLKAASARLSMLEVELGKLENRTVAASVAKEAKVDMGELMAKVRTAVRVTLDDIEVAGAMRYGDAVAKKAAPKSTPVEDKENIPVEDKENVPEQAAKKKMPKVTKVEGKPRSFFRKLFRI
ncbi:MAG: hypothetical protein KDK48_06115, partial [Chlamydiia bacterium]|nr:hypothetical protein [Chlamydiia bacterium]